MRHWFSTPFWGVIKPDHFVKQLMITFRSCQRRREKLGKTLKATRWLLEKISIVSYLFLHFRVRFVVDCSKKCLAKVAVWRSVLLKPCLSNLFLAAIVLEKATFPNMRSNSEN